VEGEEQRVRLPDPKPEPKGKKPTMPAAAPDADEEPQEKQ